MMATDALLEQIRSLADQDIGDFEHWLEPIDRLNDELAKRHGHGLYDWRICEHTDSLHMRLLSPDGETRIVLRHVREVSEQWDNLDEEPRTVVDGTALVEDIRRYVIQAVELWGAFHSVERMNSSKHLGNRKPIGASNWSNVMDDIQELEKYILDFELEYATERFTRANPDLEPTKLAVRKYWFRSVAQSIEFDLKFHISQHPSDDPDYERALSSLTHLRETGFPWQRWKEQRSLISRMQAWAKEAFHQAQILELIEEKGFVRGGAATKHTSRNCAGY